MRKLCSAGVYCERRKIGSICSVNYSLEVTHSSLTKMLSSNVSSIWCFICKENWFYNPSFLQLFWRNREIFILTAKVSLYSSIPEIKKKKNCRYNIPQFFWGEKSSEESVNTRLETRKVFGTLQKILMCGVSSQYFNLFVLI